ncbi:hypothetical protein BHE74_00005377 [Ensete ventricosum]|nr:hypothetical protein BHE74_00005377 [Ensete ventricosum]RZR79269.1 hypothetical protein BHM03_00004953 [Ensete ventricosum]
MAVRRPISIVGRPLSPRANSRGILQNPQQKSSCFLPPSLGFHRLSSCGRPTATLWWITLIQQFGRHGFGPTRLLTMCNGDAQTF